MPQPRARLQALLAWVLRYCEILDEKVKEREVERGRVQLYECESSQLLIVLLLPSERQELEEICILGAISCPPFGVSSAQSYMQHAHAEYLCHTIQKTQFMNFLNDITKRNSIIFTYSCSIVRDAFGEENCAENGREDAKARRSYG